MCNWKVLLLEDNYNTEVIEGCTVKLISFLNVIVIADYLAHARITRGLYKDSQGYKISAKDYYSETTTVRTAFLGVS